ncbi:hypothetical protein CEXT_99101 [Caerostris extrusa]|uniref:Uncharacterized protein n=1 Tax=Caerostris extrusa TaxID=172846 RepID=A0AAV4NX99_CAEEX|nr:hypothetical protein CEXT_99101 [Caerostris extrusa]
MCAVCGNVYNMRKGNLQTGKNRLPLKNLKTCVNKQINKGRCIDRFVTTSPIWWSPPLFKGDKNPVQGESCRDKANSGKGPGDGRSFFLLYCEEGPEMRLKEALWVWGK